jgi:hypothetical protein
MHAIETPLFPRARAIDIGFHVRSSIPLREVTMSPTRKIDTSRGVTRGAGGDTGPLPNLRKRVVSGDRNTGEPGDKQKKRRGKDQDGRSAGTRR